jgi:hypothetical protein
MAAMEGIVRPFVNQSTSPTAGVDSVPQPVNNAVLYINGAGATKSGGYSLSSSVTLYVKAKHRETTQSGGTLSVTSTRRSRGIWASAPVAQLQDRRIPPTTRTR